MADRMIQFTPAKFKYFEEAYEAAVKAGEDVFEFDDAEFLTGYAKYLIEYLGPQLSSRKHAIS